jgi:predicted LPLAT superfamily acyltransferase
MTSKPYLWKGKTDGGKWGQKSLFFMLGIINVTILYPVLLLIVPFYMLFRRAGYLAIFRYFKEIWGMSHWKAFWNTFANHFIFAQIVVDKFAAIAGKVKNFTIEIEGHNYIQDLYEQKKGFIIASSHIGNFELGGYVFQQDKTNLYALVYEGESKEYSKKREASLKKANLNLVSIQEDMSHLFLLKDVLEQGNIVIIQCDRIYGNSKNFKINFLGRDAWFPSGTFRLAAQLDVPVIALFIMKKSLTKYKAFIIPIETEIKETNNVKQSLKYAEFFVKSCEKILKKYPRQWFNFYNFWIEKYE